MSGKEPWIDNYPPLRDWLRKHEMRCSWQTRTMKGAHASSVEHYVAPNGRECIVVIHFNQNGWNVYTPDGGNIISNSLEDAETRMGLRQG